MDQLRAALTFEQLVGKGEHGRAPVQARALPRAVLDEIPGDAYRAFLNVPDAGCPRKSFTDVRQGTKEPYMQFVDCLKDTLDKQVSHPEAGEFLLLKLVVDNANADCQRVLRPLENSTLVQMIKACNRIGPIEHKYKAMAAAFAMWCAPPGTALVCYKCGGAGHFRKECDVGVGSQASPGICP